MEGMFVVVFSLRVKSAEPVADAGIVVREGVNWAKDGSAANDSVGVKAVA